MYGRIMACNNSKNAVVLYSWFVNVVVYGTHCLHTQVCQHNYVRSFLVPRSGARKRSTAGLTNTVPYKVKKSVRDSTTVSLHI